MTERPILRLPDARPAQRQRGQPASFPRPRAGDRQEQGARFRREFERLETALARDDSALELRRDPAGVAPERALVFVTAVPIGDFVRAARLTGLEVLGEIELEDDYELPDGLIAEHTDATTPTLYTTMPTQEALERLLRLWRAHQRGEGAEFGYAPWWTLFDMLAELRTWGPEDRFAAESRSALEDRLPFDDAEEVRLELEIWPTRDRGKRDRWRRESEARVNALGGRIVDSSTIEEGSFIYEAMLIGLSAAAVRTLIDNPSAPDGLATLDGLQFVLPQTIAQSLPDQSQPVDAGGRDAGLFDPDSPVRALLLDGTPVAGHSALDGAVIVEDVHDLVGRSVVQNRRHATSMASLILRGDLGTDGAAASDSRLMSIPVLIDTDSGATSPDDRLFVDVVHTALQSAFGGEDPLAPEAFVVNFSIGVLGSHFAGRISALGRLLDWWAREAGILFVVSAGNILDDLQINDMSALAFEDSTISERQQIIRTAQRQERHQRTLLAPAESLNGLTVGAASVDLSPPAFPAPDGTVQPQEQDDIVPAISAAVGLGPFRTIKPDLLAPGGNHEIRLQPMGDNLRLRVVRESARTGLQVATIRDGVSTTARSRGTSCAAALTTRAILNAAAGLTEEDGPYEGIELPRQDLALLTRALAVNAARWPERVDELYGIEMRNNGSRFRQAGEEVARFFGHGFVDPRLMQEAPANGTTLVGLGTVRKDLATIFDMPLPTSMSGDRVHRSMLVTLTWFSPVDPTRAKYRLAALEAISADGDILEDQDEDKHWCIDMASRPPAIDILKRGTVWSRRFVHNRVAVPDYDEDATLPIRVQCKDAAGGGLDQDENIRFAIAVTLQLAPPVRYDIHEEIRDQLRVRLRGAEPG